MAENVIFIVRRMSRKWKVLLFTITKSLYNKEEAGKKCTAVSSY
jgi:hypothetical protein